MKLSVPLGVNNIMVLPTWTICSPQIFFPKIPFFPLLSSLHDNSYKTVWLLWHCERPWKLSTAKGRCLTLRTSNWHTKKIYSSIQIKHLYDVYKHNIFIILFMNVWCFCPEDLFYVQNESCRDFLKQHSVNICARQIEGGFIVQCGICLLCQCVFVCICVSFFSFFNVRISKPPSNPLPHLFGESCFFHHRANFMVYCLPCSLSLVFSMQNAALLPMEIRNSQ